MDLKPIGLRMICEGMVSSHAGVALNGCSNLSRHQRLAPHHCIATSKRTVYLPLALRSVSLR